METKNDEAKKAAAGDYPSEKGGVAGVDSKKGELEAPPTKNSRIEKDAQIDPRAG